MIFLQTARSQKCEFPYIYYLMVTLYVLTLSCLRPKVSTFPDYVVISQYIIFNEDAKILFCFLAKILGN